MSTNTDEIIEFLGIVSDKGFLNSNTVNARLTACRKFLDILDLDQKTVEYLSENLDIIKARFMNLNKDVAGATVDEYARRVKLVIDDFTEWKADRGGWERRNAAKQSTRPAADGEKKARPKADKPKVEPVSMSKPEHSFTTDPTMRTVEIPLRNGVEAKIVIPREGFTTADVKKIAWALLPFASDFDPEVSLRDPFPMLGSGSEIRNAQ